MLQPMGSQRIGHNLATEQQQQHLEYRLEDEWEWVGVQNREGLTGGKIKGEVIGDHLVGTLLWQWKCVPCWFQA